MESYCRWWMVGFRRSQQNWQHFCMWWMLLVLPCTENVAHTWKSCVCVCFIKVPVVCLRRRTPVSYTKEHDPGINHTPMLTSVYRYWALSRFSCKALNRSEAPFHKFSRSNTSQVFVLEQLNLSLVVQFQYWHYSNSNYSNLKVIFEKFTTFYRM